MGKLVGMIAGIQLSPLTRTLSLTLVVSEATPTTARADAMSGERLVLTCLALIAALALVRRWAMQHDTRRLGLSFVSWILC